MMALPSQASNQKLACSPLKIGELLRVTPSVEPAKRLSLHPLPRVRLRGPLCHLAQVPAVRLSILIAALVATFGVAPAQEEPLGNEEHEREELGVNSYTAPSIARIFQLLDELKPLPFDQLKREFPPPISASREQKGLIFGGLIADGFLIVEAERKNLVEDLGRILIREARGLGVADRVTRHSASLTDLGRHGEWIQVRKELIATQTDVEQAMLELRDEKMAHLISLGGWLRGLEISARAVEANFSVPRAKLLAQPDLPNYFADELKTLPPSVIHAALFEKVRSAINTIHSTIEKAAVTGNVSMADVRIIRGQAQAANEAIRQIN
jgi:hypothetical protein